MGRRIFVFGCSFSSWHWATLADYIALSFDRRIMLANPGVSNRFLVDRLVELIQSEEFNRAKDHIFFQTTGWGRFSFYDRARTTWTADGDLISADNRVHNQARIRADYQHRIFSPEQAVYDNYIALQTARMLLEAEKISHTLVVGLDFVELFDPALPYQFTQEIQSRVVELEKQYLGDRPSLYQFGVSSQGREGYNRQFQDGSQDGHPFPEDMWQYLIRYFREFESDLGHEFYQEACRQFDWSSIRSQGQQYQKLKQQYRIIPITSSYMTELFLPENYFQFPGVRFN